MIELPKEKSKPTAINPRHMVLSGKHKSGKTSAVAGLKNCLILDVEDGSAFIEGLIMKSPKEYGPVSRYKWLKEVAATIKEAGCPYDYIVIDTLSQLDLDAEYVGTHIYMNTLQGKKFNRDIQGNILKPSDPSYETVHSLPNGFGYKYSREAIMDIFNEFKDLSKICTIFICHVADKMIANKAGEEVMVKDLALTGN